jgi:hypothetical protein
MMIIGRRKGPARRVRIEHDGGQADEGQISLFCVGRVTWGHSSQSLLSGNPEAQAGPGFCFSRSGQPPRCSRSRKGASLTRPENESPLPSCNRSLSIGLFRALRGHALSFLLPILGPCTGPFLYAVLSARPVHGLRGFARSSKLVDSVRYLLKPDFQTGDQEAGNRIL